MSRVTTAARRTLLVLTVWLLLAGLLYQPVFCQASKSRNARRRVANKVKRSPAVRRKTAKHSAATKNNRNALAIGSWGGEHIRLVSSSEGATIELDCAHATIEAEIYLNQDNCFDMQGLYFEEHAGPPRPGEQIRSYPARVRGCVRQSTMNLTITPDDTSKAGAFTLNYDQAASIVKCL
jgi:hypothetical protein